MSGRTSLAFSAYLPLTASMSLVGLYVALSKPLVAVLPVFVLAFLRFGIWVDQFPNIVPIHP